MATSQHAQHIESSTQDFSHKTGFISSLIDLDYVSVSQLLGRDYIFIHTDAFNQPLGNTPTCYGQLEMVIRQLELAQTHTVVVTFHQGVMGKPSFTRHDLTWYKGKICRIESQLITHQDQLEFMDMIWQCSTSATPA